MDALPIPLSFPAIDGSLPVHSATTREVRSITSQATSDAAEIQTVLMAEPDRESRRVVQARPDRREPPQEVQDENPHTRLASLADQPPEEGSLDILA